MPLSNIFMFVTARKSCAGNSLSKWSSIVQRCIITGLFRSCFLYLADTSLIAILRTRDLQADETALLHKQAGPSSCLSVVFLGNAAHIDNTAGNFWPCHGLQLTLGQAHAVACEVADVCSLPQVHQCMHEGHHPICREYGKVNKHQGAPQGQSLAQWVRD